MPSPARPQLPRRAGNLYGEGENQCGRCLPGRHPGALFRGQTRQTQDSKVLVETDGKDVFIEDLLGVLQAAWCCIQEGLEGDEKSHGQGQEREDSQR